jgi:membrane associated rhomboid family serine protease
MRCPECAGERQKVYTRSDIAPGGGVAAFFAEVPVTATLIAVNVTVFLLQIATGFPLALMGSGGGWVTEHGLFLSPLIAQGEWWRIVTPGFLHLGLLHLGLNMYLLYILGRMLEPELGALQMLAVYFAALIAGSLGAMILEPDIPSAGASGAIFGLMGMALVAARSRRLKDAFQQIGILVLLNLVITFGYSGIAKGAHLGGLIGGALCGLLIFELGERRRALGEGPRHWVGTVSALALALIFFVACILLARHQYPQLT